LANAERTQCSPDCRSADTVRMPSAGTHEVGGRALPALRQSAEDRFQGPPNSPAVSSRPQAGPRERAGPAPGGRPHGGAARFAATQGGRDARAPRAAKSCRTPRATPSVIEQGASGRWARWTGRPVTRSSRDELQRGPALLPFAPLGRADADPGRRVERAGPLDAGKQALPHAPGPTPKRMTCRLQLANPRVIPPHKPSGSIPESGLLPTYPYRFIPPAYPLGSRVRKRPRVGS
jgi:hypothetical protein